MTIDKHLQFSVLCAPLAACDRRTLSQAWYSALYGTQRTTLPRQAGAKELTATSRSGGAARNGSVATSSRVQTRLPQNRPLHDPASKHGTCVERRASRTDLAKRIERKLHSAALKQRSQGFSVESPHGRVKIVLQQRSAGVTIVALCAPKAREAVAQALLHARYALAARGIALQGTVRAEAGS